MYIKKVCHMSVSWKKIKVKITTRNYNQAHEIDINNFPCISEKDNGWMNKLIHLTLCYLVFRPPLKHIRLVITSVLYTINNNSKKENTIKKLYSSFCLHKGNTQAIKPRTTSDTLERLVCILDWTISITGVLRFSSFIYCLKR